MNEIEVSVHCYSEKENAGVGFGISLDLDAESFQSIGTDWICEGMADCFYENYFEFEPGINKAKLLSENNLTLTFRQALYNVFGDFWVSYYIDDDRAELQLEFNFEEAMYDLLEGNHSIPESNC